MAAGENAADARGAAKANEAAGVKAAKVSNTHTHTHIIGFRPNACATSHHTHAFRPNAHAFRPNACATSHHTHAFRLDVSAASHHTHAFRPDVCATSHHTHAFRPDAADPHTPHHPSLSSPPPSSPPHALQSTPTPPHTCTGTSRSLVRRTRIASLTPSPSRLCWLQQYCKETSA
jgi:hypothetical protein